MSGVTSAVRSSRPVKETTGPSSATAMKIGTPARRDSATAMAMTPAVRILALASCALLAAGACARTDAGGPFPPVVLVSLDTLRQAKELAPGNFTKSSLMLGLGETADEVADALGRLRAAEVDFLTLGQYLRPTPNHAPVADYVEPARFDALRAEGERLGFRYVAAGPLVRSSYRAGEFFAQRLVRERRDSQGDGRFDTVDGFDERGELRVREEDRNGDGRVDVRSRYRNGRLDRREILDRVWSDVVVTDGALSQAVRILRRTLGDDPRRGEYIRTISRHGYRFVFAEVAEEADDVCDPPKPPSHGGEGGPPSDESFESALAALRDPPRGRCGARHPARCSPPP